MSALPPKADIALHRSECPLCAKSGHRANHSLDHLIGTAKQGEWDSQAKRFRGLHVYNELDFARLLHRQICWLVALKNATHVNSQFTCRIKNGRRLSGNPQNPIISNPRADYLYFLSNRVGNSIRYGPRVRRDWARGGVLRWS